MEPVTILLGLGIGAFALGHYFFWGKRRTELKGEWPYFIRRGILEPSLKQVEKWGAGPDEIPTAIVAVAYPERERARLRVAGALMGPTRGNVLVVSVGPKGSSSPMDALFTSTGEKIAERVSCSVFLTKPK